MTREEVKKEFLSFKDKYPSIEADYRILDEAYYDLSDDDFEIKMLNILSTYTLIPTLGLYERASIAEGIGLFQDAVVENKFKSDEELLLEVVDTCNGMEDFNPYIYMGIITAYKGVKEMHKKEAKVKSKETDKRYS